jgi:hypothetical protein
VSMAVTGGLEWVEWPRDPTLTDNGMEWPGGTRHEDLWNIMFNGMCPEASSVLGMGN